VLRDADVEGLLALIAELPTADTIKQDIARLVGRIRGELERLIW